MERNEQGLPKKSDFRAGSKILKFCQETRKIPEFSGKSKNKNSLLPVETHEEAKKLENMKTQKNLDFGVFRRALGSVKTLFSKNIKSSFRPDNSRQILK